MLPYIPYMDPMGMETSPVMGDFPSQAEQRRVLEELRLHKAFANSFAKLGRGCYWIKTIWCQLITDSCPQES